MGQVIVELPDGSRVSGAHVEVTVPAGFIFYYKRTVTTDTEGVALFRDPGLAYGGTVGTVKVDCRVDGQDYTYRGEWSVSIWGVFSPSVKECVLTEQDAPEEKDKVAQYLSYVVYGVGAVAAIVIIGPVVSALTRPRSRRGVY